MAKKNKLDSDIYPKPIALCEIIKSVAVKYTEGYQIFHILENGEILNPNNCGLSPETKELLNKYYKDNYDKN
jgi:hypothetical protein